LCFRGTLFLQCCSDEQGLIIKWNFRNHPQSAKIGRNFVILVSMLIA
jgi:hypothetical protein